MADASLYGTVTGSGGEALGAGGGSVGGSSGLSALQRQLLVNILTKGTTPQAGGSTPQISGAMGGGAMTPGHFTPTHF
jgi:hypothetical protein